MKMDVENQFIYIYCDAALNVSLKARAEANKIDMVVLVTAPESIRSWFD